MRAEIKHINGNLQLIVKPESSEERSMMNELVSGDRYHKVFLSSKWNINTEYRNDTKSIASLSIGRKTSLNERIITQYGFERFPNSYSPCLFTRKMVGFTYILVGDGVYSVFKSHHDFDSYAYQDGYLRLYAGGEEVEAFRKKKDRFAVVGTLGELKNILAQNKGG